MTRPNEGLKPDEVSESETDNFEIRPGASAPKRLRKLRKVQLLVVQREENDDSFLRIFEAICSSNRDNGSVRLLEFSVPLYY